MITGICKLRREVHANSESRVVDEGQLIEQARSNPEAFARLYRRHYDVVFRYCVHRLFDRQIAEDITSEVFLSVVENFTRFKGSEEQFRNWIYKIATNAVNNHLRKAARRGDLLKHAGGTTAGQVVDCGSSSQEKLALLKEAVLSLRPRYQTIMTLRFFENLKLTEIAEVLGSSDGTVRSQLARALAKLRKKMNASGQEV